MKILSVILMFLLFNKASGQDIAGDYNNFSGSTLQLKQDSTFKYSWNFDLVSSWTTGRWTVKDDTVYLEAVPVYDTLKFHPIFEDVIIDSLVLSLDSKSESITAKQYYKYSLVSGGQNKYKNPDKLFYRKGKLYQVNQKGNLMKKKQRGFWSKKKYPSYYKRK